MPPAALEEPPLPPVSFDVKRITAIVVAAAGRLSDPHWLTSCWPLVGVALLSAVLPHGSLMSTMEHATPSLRWRWRRGGPRLRHAAGRDVAARLDVPARQLGRRRLRLLDARAGINLGRDRLGVSELRAGAGLLWLAILLVVVLALPTRSKTPSIPARSSPRAHTRLRHLLPSLRRTAYAGPPQGALAKLNEDVHPFERAGLTLLGTWSSAG